MSSFLHQFSEKGFEPLREDSDLEHFFTNAEYARDLFLGLISSKTISKNLLVIHGVGGVGKSTLLRMYRLLCHRRGIPVGLVDAEDASSSVDVLSNWADDLSSLGLKLRKFSKSLKLYRSLQSKIEVEAKKTTSVVSKASEELGKAAAQAIVGAAGSAIPVIGPLVAALGGMGTGAFIDWLHSFMTQSEIDFYVKPERRLTNDFLEDLNRETKRTRIVLMIDTYEQAATLEDWLGEVASALSDNILLVIAGRSIPAWEQRWPGWMGRAEIVELETMSDEDLVTLVDRYYEYTQGNRPDPKQAKIVARFARGLPIVVTTVVQLWVRYGVEDFYTVRSQVMADLVDRLLEGIPEDMLPAFEACSILRYFNVESLQALLEEGDAGAMYAELRRWPFVRPRREGLAVHDTMREVINEALRMRTPRRFRTLHGRAVRYYAALAQESTAEKRERFIREKLYHQVRADLQRGVDGYVLAVEEAARSYALAFGSLLIEDLSSLQIEQDLSCYVFYAKGLMRLANNCFGEAILLFQRVATLQEGLGVACSDEISFKSTERLAYALTLEGRLEDALEAYKRSVQLATRAQNPIWQIHAWNGIETVLRRLGYVGRAIDALENSIRACEHIGMERSFEMAWAQDSLGIALGMIGMLEDAVRHHRRALEIYKSLSNDYNAAIVLHNMTLLHSGSPAQSIDAFEEALSVFRKLDDRRWIRYCELSIAETLADLGKWERAERYIKYQGEQDSRAQIRNYRLLGDIQRHTGKLQESLSSYEKALGIADRQNRWREKKGLLLRLSSLLLSQGKLDQASRYVAAAEEMLHDREFYDHLAHLRLLQGHIAWSRCTDKREQESCFDVALVHYRQALIFALRYNRFLLDKVLGGHQTANTLFPAILPYCMRQGEEGQQMLASILEWWQKETNEIHELELDTLSPIPQGIRLVEAEQVARDREPGDGSPQVTVVERIERILRADS